MFAKKVRKMWFILWQRKSTTSDFGWSPGSRNSLAAGWAGLPKEGRTTRGGEL